MTQRKIELLPMAQLVFIPYETGDLTVVEELDETERGAGGFGSTGK